MGTSETLQAFGLTSQEASVESGRVSRLDVTAERFLAVADGLLRGEPIAALRLVAGEQLVGALQHPLMKQVGSLSFRSKPKLTATGVGALAAAATLEGLRALDLSGHPIGDAGVQVLAASPWLARIESLDLGHCQIGPEGARAIAESPHLSGLRELGLHGNAIGDAGALHLARSSRLSLRQLSVNNNGLGPTGVSALASCPALGGVERFSLGYGNDCGAHGVAAIAAAPMTKTLTLLDVSACALGDAGARTLAKSPFAVLRELGLNDDAITERGACDVVDAPWFDALITLRLSSNPIGPVIGAALARRRHAALQDLVLADVGLGDGGAVALGDAALLSHLRILSLCGNSIGPTGLAAIVEGNRLSRVAELFCSRNPLGDPGATLLARHLPASLCQLWLDDCGIGDEGAKELARALSNIATVDVVLSDNPIAEASHDQLRAQITGLLL